MLTLDEQERAAYMAGDTRTAELLAQLIDAEDEIAAQGPALEGAYEEGYRDGVEAAKEQPHD